MTQGNHSRYWDAIQYLYGLQKYGIKFGLSKTSNLLDAFGNPHRGRRYVHIGGTNGKGSVAAMAASVLIKSGMKVGVYSSPHLVRFTERFRINDHEIDRDQAATLIREIKEVINPEHPPTFFEVTTAMALIHFAREETDVDVMEVGMGGRLDATNIITPMVSVITNISLEHQDFLGPRLTDIAGEKAGIIKEGVDLVTGATQPEVLRVFETICRKKGAPFLRVGRDVRYRSAGSGFHYYGLRRRLKALDLELKGRHQVRNAALSLAALEVLERKGFQFSSEQIREGLRDAKWPGRLQLVSRRPDIILDGAHNPAAVRTLATTIRLDFRFRRMILVLGVMADKDIRGIVQGIVPLADHVIYTRPQYERAASPEVIMREARPLGKKGEILPSIPEAIDKAKEMAHPRDLILVCGSLFTVGEAMSYFDPQGNGPEGP